MGKQFETDKPTFEEIKALRKPKTSSVWVPLDAELIDRMEELERQIRIEERLDRRENRKPVAPQLQTQLEELRDRAEEIAVKFELRELSRKQYKDIIAEHPDPEGKLRWNEETFAPALIAAACVQPEMTPEQSQELWDEWGPSVAYLIFGTAVEVCEGPTRVPFGEGDSPGTPDSEPSSTTADPEESPTADS